jgi:ABC-2 type transport system ATP-binding protein
VTAPGGAPSPGERPKAVEAPAVQLSGLGRAFGALAAVDGLTFAVGRGELFGLVGPDGAGKTTTLRMLAGILPPTAGDAQVAGYSVRRAPEALKARIGYMSQRFGLYPDLTVLENVHFYADLFEVPRRVRAARIERLLAFSQLAPFGDRAAGKLSGGMKQKLGLACALVHQPEVLLLDEPTNGVDPVSRRDFWRILYDMLREGVTVVVATAYLDEAERCNRVALLHRGRLLALDTPEAIRRRLAVELVEVRVTDAWQGRAVLAGVPAVRAVTLFGGRLHVEVADAARDLPAVLAALAAAGLEPTGARRVAPALEDAFIALIGRAGGGGPGDARAA